MRIVLEFPDGKVKSLGTSLGTTHINIMNIGEKISYKNELYIICDKIHIYEEDIDKLEVYIKYVLNN